MRFRSISFGFFTSLALVSANLVAQPAPIPSPTQDPFIHGADVTMKVISISQHDLLIECTNPKRVWREHYMVYRDHLILWSVLMPSATQVGNWEERKIYRPEIKRTQTRSAIFEDDQVGSSNIGAISFDKKWTNYGAYLHKMLEAIQVEWDKNLTDSQSDALSGTSVTVMFTLNSSGAVKRIVIVESDSSQQGKEHCMSAISNPAPYGVWTNDMKNVLGGSQDITIKFYYQ